MNFRRLRYFVKCVDIGSLTQAADILHVAQPALSQQLTVLEHEVKQTLLIRNKRGVTPTEAGKVLYAHAQRILRQCEQAQREIQVAGRELTGFVTVGLAQCSVASRLAVPLLQAVRQAQPGITLHINENSGVPTSEMVMNGRIDLAILGTTLYGSHTPHGIVFTPLVEETLCLFCAEPLEYEGAIDMETLATMELILPSPNHFLRRAVDEAFKHANATPRLVAEISTVQTMLDAVAQNVGAALLPESLAAELSARYPALHVAAVVPSITASLALCESASMPLSLPAQAVKQILVDLARATSRLGFTPT